jgi:endoribonuclease Nob1
MVLDTSAFVAGFDPFSIKEEQITPPKVEEELKKNAMNLLRFKMALDSGRLKIFAPSEDTLKKVKASASSLGDSFFLSETDMQVLALALEVKEHGNTPQIISDDYSIQNVATYIGVGFVALATFGIRRLLTWIRYCPACYKKYSSNCKATTCSVCGTKLKRKPQR